MNDRGSPNARAVEDGEETIQKRKGHDDGISYMLVCKYFWKHISKPSSVSTCCAYLLAAASARRTSVAFSLIIIVGRTGKPVHY